VMSKKKPKRHTEKPNQPFSQLPSLLAEAGIDIEEGEVPVAVEEKPVPPREDEDSLFEMAMEGVAPVSWRNKPLATGPPAPIPRADPESEDYRLMCDAAAGIPALSIDDHPEYIEGWIGIAGRRYLPNLRSGLYSIQGQIDLHGLSRIEARGAVKDFIVRNSRLRACCVKIIHGRGINSSNDRAILKENLQRWLSTRRMGRYVVAYSSAPFKDGGVGAVYVLLRRTPA